MWLPYLSTASTPTTAEVPNVVGKSQSDATSTLTDAGFKVTVKTGTSADQPAGNVYAQSPDAGISLKLGQPVTIFVSTGPPEPDPTTTP